MAKRVAIIDYGMGNLHSVASALHCIDNRLDVKVTADPQLIREAEQVIFPGVGAMGDCMSEILRLNIDKALGEALDEGKPVLAICVGMQALMQYSQESGGVDCLAHFSGQVVRFSENDQFQQANHGKRLSLKMKVPHMGWNTVQQSIDHPLWHNIKDEARFYFVHSYYVQPNLYQVVSGRCNYGVSFAAALASDNLFATQFHPEKSHNNGLQLLKNFVYWSGKC